MKTLCSEYGIPIDFEISSNWFRVVIKRAVEKTSEKTSEKILMLIRENPEISAANIAKEVGISSRAVEMQISKLKKQGKIKRVGSAKGGHWEILKLIE